MIHRTEKQQMAIEPCRSAVPWPSDVEDQATADGHQLYKGPSDRRFQWPFAITRSKQQQMAIKPSAPVTWSSYHDSEDGATVDGYGALSV